MKNSMEGGAAKDTAAAISVSRATEAMNTVRVALQRTPMFAIKEKRKEKLDNLLEFYDPRQKNEISKWLPVQINYKSCLMTRWKNGTYKQQTLVKNK